jgi:DME family drug/metabolite transporter
MATAVLQRAHTRRASLSVATAALLWGTVGVAGRALGESTALDPLTVGWYRLAVATALLAGVRLLRTRSLPRVARRDLPLAAGIGGLLAFYQVCFFAAVEAAGVGVATLVTLGLAPVLVAVGDAATGGGRPSRRLVAALSAALAGLALLLGTPGDGTLAGAAWAVGSATGYAGVALLSRGLAERIQPADLTLVSFAAGAALLLPVAAGAGLSLPASTGGFATLLYLGAVPSALAYALFFAGMRATPATTAAVITLLEPLTAALLAAALYGERLGTTGTAGAALLLAAVLALALARPSAAT